jgi:hypothetical protein
LHQQELDAAAAHPVANCGNLLAFLQLAKLGQANEPGRSPVCANQRLDDC